MKTILTALLLVSFTCHAGDREQLQALIRMYVTQGDLEHAQRLVVTPDDQMIVNGGYTQRDNQARELKLDKLRAHAERRSQAQTIRCYTTGGSTLCSN